MRAIPTDEFETELEMNIKRIFKCFEPVIEPFQDAVEHRLLLYPIQYSLQEPWLSTFVSGLNQLGERGFYASIIGGWIEGVVDQTQCHWYVPLQDVDQYSKETGSTSNILYSANGSWGMIFSFDEYAILGGSQILADLFVDNFPDLHERVGKFLTYWRYNYDTYDSDISWIPSLLSHVYGEEGARKLIESSDLKGILEV